MQQKGTLDDLCQKLGIQLSYTDTCKGVEQKADIKSKKALCKAMGYPAETKKDVLEALKKLRQEEYKNFVPFTRVAQEWELKPFSVEISIPQAQQTALLSWILTAEDGTSSSGQISLQDSDLLDTMTIGTKKYQKRRVRFILDAPIGYHTLSFLIDGEKPDSNNQIKLIVVPQKCFMHPELENGRRVWGFPMQLYAISSTHNWGIGDFTDLKNLIPVGKKFGASLIGINPISALFSDDANDASPYYSSSRIFLNPLYIDLDAVPEAAESLPYTEYKNSPRFVEVFKYAKASDKVEYPYIAEMKYTALGFLFDTFKAVHLNDKFEPITARGEAFQEFCDKFGAKLVNFATFQTIRNVRLANGKSQGCWWEWEKGFQTPKSEKVAAFQEEYIDSIVFIKYQQFLAFEQYEAVGEEYVKSGMEIGLYTDLPVGVGKNSAEVWSNQDVFLPELNVGAPPDSFNKKGQDWSLAAFNPKTLGVSGYDLFIRIIRAVMNKAGAVRIDHAFGLQRLFLRPSKGAGAYLTYPFKDMMGIIALESHRQKCMVIAEDLGTAPYGFSAQLRESNVLSFGIFHWNRTENGFIMPQDYPHNYLIASGTHDLPTYTALWKGLDLELSKKMKLITPEQYKHHIENRKNERYQFLTAFVHQGMPVPGCERMEGSDDAKCQNMRQIMSGEIVPSWFIPNTYAFLARTNAMILLVRMEDILEQEEQINLPGTYLQYPNWRYKLPVLLEGLSTDERMINVCAVINKERPL